MSLLARLRRFARATGGIAAIEFAILLPMMVFTMFGSIDLIDMLGANRRAQNVAASVADVVARDDAVSDSERDGLWAATNILMYPDSATTMRIRVSSILIANATTARVVWSEAHGGYTPLTVNSTVALPTAMMNTGTSIIMTETIYTYTPPLGFLFNGSIGLTHVAYRRSRLVDPIPRIP